MALEHLDFSRSSKQAYTWSDSVKAPLRQHRLLTMTSKKTRKPKGTPKEREANRVIKCLKSLRRRLAWSNHHKSSRPSDEQYSVLPSLRAISDEEGNPHKGQKSGWTSKLASRYHMVNPPVFASCLPFTPESIIVDAMFIINTKPLRQTRMVEEYAHFLFNRFVLSHFKAGTLEVHLVFDKPAMQLFDPKQFEHAKRYSKSDSDHQHYSFSPQSTIPSNSWQQYMQCRQCKRLIVEGVGLALLQRG